MIGVCFGSVYGVSGALESVVGGSGEVGYGVEQCTVEVKYH